MLCLDERLPRSPASHRVPWRALPRELLGGQEVPGAPTPSLLRRLSPGPASATAPRGLPWAAQHPQPGFVPLGLRTQPCPLQYLPLANNHIAKRKHFRATFPSCPANFSLLVRPLRSSKSVHAQPAPRAMSPSDHKPRSGSVYQLRRRSAQPWCLLMTNNPDFLQLQTRGEHSPGQEPKRLSLPPAKLDYPTLTAGAVQAPPLAFGFAQELFMPRRDIYGKETANYLVFS